MDQLMLVAAMAVAAAVAGLSTHDQLVSLSQVRRRYFSRTNNRTHRAHLHSVLCKRLFVQNLLAVNIHGKALENATHTSDGVRRRRNLHLSFPRGRMGRGECLSVCWNAR
jgi:hypothetical protein